MVAQRRKPWESRNMETSPPPEGGIFRKGVSPVRMAWFPTYAPLSLTADDAQVLSLTFSEKSPNSELRTLNSEEFPSPCLRDSVRERIHPGSPHCVHFPRPLCPLAPTLRGAGHRARALLPRCRRQRCLHAGRPGRGLEGGRSGRALRRGRGRSRHRRQCVLSGPERGPGPQSGRGFAGGRPERRGGCAGAVLSAGGGRVPAFGPLAGRGRPRPGAAADAVGTPAQVHPHDADGFFLAGEWPEHPAPVGCSSCKFRSWKLRPPSEAAAA